MWSAEWSAPSAIGIAGLGGGFEVGAEVNTAYLSFGRNEVVQLQFCSMFLMKQALGIITIRQGQRAVVKVLWDARECRSPTSNSWLKVLPYLRLL